MSFSQVTMAALVHGGRLAICGDLTAEETRNAGSAEIFFVVHQDGTTVRGRGERFAGDTRWGACSRPDQPSLTPGQAVVFGLIVMEGTGPIGFTTFTWTQEVTIEDGLPPGRPDPCAST